MAATAVDLSAVRTDAINTKATFRTLIGVDAAGMSSILAGMTEAQINAAIAGATSFGAGLMQLDTDNYAMLVEHPDGDFPVVIGQPGFDDFGAGQIDNLFLLFGSNPYLNGAYQSAAHPSYSESIENFFDTGSQNVVEHYFTYMSVDRLTTYRPWIQSIDIDTHKVYSDYTQERIRFVSHNALTGGRPEFQFVLDMDNKTNTFYSPLDVDTSALSGQNRTLLKVYGNQGTGNFCELENTGALGEGQAMLYMPIYTTANNVYPLKVYGSAASFVIDVRNAAATGTTAMSLVANRDVYHVVETTGGTQFSFGIDYSDDKAFNVCNLYFLHDDYKCLRIDRTTKKVTVYGPLELQDYTVGTVPSASTSGTGSTIVVTDDVEGLVVATADSTNNLWRTGRKAGVSTSTATSLLAAAVAYFDCQEASGDLVDAIGSVHAVASGSPTYANRGPTPWLENAIGVSSGNYFATAGDVNAVDFGTGSFTICAWVRRTLTTYEVIVGKSTAVSADNFRCFNYNGNAQLIRGNDGTFYNASAAIPLKQWAFVAWGRDATGGKSFVYINGRRTEYTETANQSQSNALALTIGTDGLSYPFTGKIAGLSFHGSALTNVQLDIIRLGIGF